MALKAFGAFAAGVVVGWTGRTVFGSTRELMVQALVTAHEVQGHAKRLLAERFEWAEDMFAEGRARYEGEGAEGGHVSSTETESGALDRGPSVATSRATNRGRAA
jgi:hypothetical protein